MSQCRDCGISLTLTDGERAFFEEKGFQLPSRCSNCRRNNKSGGRGGRGGRGGGGGGRNDRRSEAFGQRKDAGGSRGGAPWPMTQHADRPLRRLSDENRGPRSPMRVKYDADYVATPMMHLFEKSQLEKKGSLMFVPYEIPESDVPLPTFQPRRQQVCRIVLSEDGDFEAMKEGRTFDKEETKAVVQQVFSDCAEAGGVLGARVNVGRSLFVVPEEYVNTPVQYSNLNKLVESRFIFPFFYPWIEQRCAHEDEVVNEYLTKTSHWTYTKKTREIRVMFADLAVARIALSDEKKLSPIEPSAEELEANKKLLAGKALSSRVDPMKVTGDDDRIVLPPCDSKDIRVFGSKTLETQHNLVSHHFVNGSGWEGKVTVDTEIEHVDHTHTHRPVNADFIRVNVSFRREHMSKDSKFTPGDAGYPSHIMSFMRPGCDVEYRLILLEHAPPEEGDPPASTADAAYAICGDIVKDVDHLMPVIDDALVSERKAEEESKEKLNEMIQKAKIH